MMAGMVLMVAGSVVEASFVGQCGPAALAGLTLVLLLIFTMTAWLMISARILLGLNDPNLSLLVVLVRLFGFAVPIAYLAAFAFHARIDGIWAGIVEGKVAAIWIRRIVWRGDPTARAAQRTIGAPARVEAA